MSRYYELTLIIKPDIDDTGATALLERVSGFITNEGGKILKTNLWGMRRLMYPIRKFRDGRYVFNLLELDANSVSRIDNRLRLTEDIIRFLFIRADDDLDVSRLLEVPPEAQAGTESQPAASATAPSTTVEVAATAPSTTAPSTTVEVAATAPSTTAPSTTVEVAAPAPSETPATP